MGQRKWLAALLLLALSAGHAAALGTDGGARLWRGVLEQVPQAQARVLGKLAPQGPLMVAQMCAVGDTLVAWAPTRDRTLVSASNICFGPLGAQGDVDHIARSWIVLSSAELDAADGDAADGRAPAQAEAARCAPEPIDRRRRPWPWRNPDERRRFEGLHAVCGRAGGLAEVLAARPASAMPSEAGLDGTVRGLRPATYPSQPTDADGGGTCMPASEAARPLWRQTNGYPVVTQPPSFLTSTTRPVLWRAGTTMVHTVDGHLGHYFRLVAPVMQATTDLVERGLAVDRFFFQHGFSAWTSAVLRAVLPPEQPLELDRKDASPEAEDAVHCFEHALFLPQYEDFGLPSDYDVLRARVVRHLATIDIDDTYGELAAVVVQNGADGASGDVASSRQLRVTMLQRPFKRSIVNWDDLVERVRALVPSNAVIRTVEFEQDTEASAYQQLRLMTLDTDLFIAAHGAALANLLFLPKEAVVIELFGYFVDFPLYGEFARARELRGHFAWHAPDARFASPMDVSGASDCVAHWRRAMPNPASCKLHEPCLRCMRDKQNVIVDLDAFSDLLRRALDLRPGMRDVRVTPVYDFGRAV